MEVFQDCVQSWDLCVHVISLIRATRRTQFALDLITGVSGDHNS